MAIVRSNKYNDPAIGAIFENIAGMFAPPSAGDTVNYAQANEINQKIGIIEKLKSDPRYAGADAGVLANLFDPTNSFYAQDQNNATAIRGQDVTAATSRFNNAADNQRAFVTDMFQPLSQGEVRPDVPLDISTLFDVPGALPQVAGAPKPLSETEARGALIQQAPALNDQQLTALVMGSTPTTNVVGADGKPVISYESAAVGQEPFFNKGAEAKPENAVAQLPDGRQVPALQGEDGAWYHAQTGEKLPTDIQVFKIPAPQGSASDVGLGKPTANYIDRALIDIAVAKDTASKLRGLIANAPASQGAVGWLRGTTQNVLQVGDEVSTFFGGQLAEVQDALKSGAADAGLAGAFDTNIPAIEMMANLLAFQYAKTTTGERLSNEMLRAAKQALGLEGLDANQASSLARLDQAIAQIGSQEAILKKAKGEGVDSLSTPAAPTNAGNAPDGWDPTDWSYLTAEEQQQVLNGN